MNNIISYLEYHLSEFTESEQRIAKYYIDADKEAPLKIVDVAGILYVSTATISRFVNKIGFSNYKEFLYEFSKALEVNISESIHMNQEALDMWDIHSKFYDKLYKHFATIDLNYLANKMLNARQIYTFGFGKTQDAMNMIIYRLETITQKMRSITHYEHLMYTVDTVMNYESLVVVFYHSEYFNRELANLMKLCKSKYVPLMIITLNNKIEPDNHATIIQLYPFKDETLTKYATTMYSPFLLYIDGLYLALFRKLSLTKGDFIYY